MTKSWPRLILPTIHSLSGRAMRPTIIEPPRAVGFHGFDRGSLPGEYGEAGTHSREWVEGGWHPGVPTKRVVGDVSPTGRFPQA